MAWDDNLEGPGREFAANEAARVRALAGPGTGKTHSLLRRIARLLEAGLRGTELLVLTFARTAAHDLVDKLRRLGEQDERYREKRARTLHAYAFGVLGGEDFLRASDRVPRIALEFEGDFLLQDLQGAFDHTLTGRRELTKAFEAAWARAQTDHPGQPVDGLDQSFQDALLGSLRWHKAMLVQGGSSATSKRPYTVSTQFCASLARVRTDVRRCASTRRSHLKASNNGASPTATGSQARWALNSAHVSCASQ